jgi:hypothetical protein
MDIRRRRRRRRRGEDLSENRREESGGGEWKKEAKLPRHGMYLFFETVVCG